MTDCQGLPQLITTKADFVHIDQIGLLEEIVFRRNLEFFRQQKSCLDSFRGIEA